MREVQRLEEQHLQIMHVPVVTERIGTSYVGLWKGLCINVLGNGYS